ncbi:MAG: DUF4340 domain-containing protein [Desulfobacteraceae bacterium]
MKKEYFVLAAVIAALSVYLLLHKENRDNYVLPEMASLEVSDITEIDIEKQESRFSLEKKEGSWFVNQERFPADSEKIDTIIDVVKDLDVTALVSEKNDLARYHLDRENKIRVEVMAGDETVRKFDLGKPAPTYHHTFVRLEGDKKVYHARTDFRSDFDVTLDDLRDKTVFSFDRKSVQTVAVEKEGKREVFFQEERSQEAKASPETPAEEKEQKVWQAKSGVGFDKEALNALLSMVSDLSCSGYAGSGPGQEAPGRDEPICKITVDDATLRLYGKNQAERYLGISSQNRYPFLLDRIQADDLISKVDLLLGLTERETEEPPQS